MLTAEHACTFEVTFLIEVHNAPSLRGLRQTPNPQAKVPAKTFPPFLLLWGSLIRALQPRRGEGAFHCHRLPSAPARAAQWREGLRQEALCAARPHLSAAPRQPRVKAAVPERIVHEYIMRELKLNSSRRRAPALCLSSGCTVSI